LTRSLGVKKAATKAGDKKNGGQTLACLTEASSVGRLLAKEGLTVQRVVEKRGHEETKTLRGLQKKRLGS